MMIYCGVRQLLANRTVNDITRVVGMELQVFLTWSQIVSSERLTAI